MARSPRTRKVIALTLTGLSAAALVGAALVKWEVAPRLIKIPETGTSTTVSEGDGQALDVTSGHLVPIRARATLTVTALPKDSTSNVTVASAITCIYVLAPDANASSQGCVPADDPNFVTASSEQIAMDRKTGESVRDDGRYGTNVNQDKAIPHVGLTYTFPIGTKKHDYTLFDPTAGKAYPIRYLGTDTVRGLHVYRFEQQLGPTAIKIQNTLPGTYTNTHTVWVEPVTGSIVRDRQVVAETLDGGQLALGGTLDFTPATVAKAVHDAKSMKDEIGLLRFWAPLGLLLLGVILVPVIVWLVRVRRAAVPDQPAGAQHHLDRDVAQPPGQFAQHPDPVAAGRGGDVEAGQRADPAEVTQPVPRQDVP